MFYKFSVIGSSLKLLKTGEQGIVKFCNIKDEKILRELISMGLRPGISITLEQRVPCFVIRVGERRLTLTREIAQRIYVRIDDH
ncbi:FeoA family protein [Mastigocladopsis repens]|uniref:FeoA family protein n=1 Tax=Mastigocladopsis repens TaxID=221287 RepID=UPI00031E1367|nr:FeoA family protein [Mastigocladopsis repens]